MRGACALRSYVLALTYLLSVEGESLAQTWGGALRERFDLGVIPLPEIQHPPFCSWSPWRFSQDLFHVEDMAPGGCPLGFPGHRGPRSVSGGQHRFHLGLSRGARKLQSVCPSRFYDSVVSIHTCSP